MCWTKSIHKKQCWRIRSFFDQIRILLRHIHQIWIRQGEEGVAGLKIHVYLIILCTVLGDPVPDPVGSGVYLRIWIWNGSKSQRIRILLCLLKLVKLKSNLALVYQ